MRSRPPNERVFEIWLVSVREAHPEIQVPRLMRPIVQPPCLPAHDQKAGRGQRNGAGTGRDSRSARAALHPAPAAPFTNPIAIARGSLGILRFRSSTDW